jgi:hypothetical protein
MNVAIFETEHFEGAFPVIRLFDKPGNDITVYTSQETHKRFADLFGANMNRFNWIILPGNSKRRFFFSLYKNLKKQNPALLYINTISSNHLLYAFVLTRLHLKRVSLTVHDINCLFESRSAFGFRKAVIHWGKKSLIKRATEFNVVADTMLPYIKTKAKGKAVHNIPGCVFEARHIQQSISEALRIVVPGSLDGRRRNYDRVFELADLANKEKLPVQIILLGGWTDEYGKSIINRAAAFKAGHCSVISYDTMVVDQAEFDKQMDEAHFVFIPSVINTKICGDIPEVYGLTKSSGNIFDVIKHAKPFIVPVGLTVSLNLQTSCFTYNFVGEIVSFLKSFIVSPAQYNRWQDEALKNSRYYTIDKVRERNPALFNNV